MAEQTRAEHLQWCKDRALEYADKGDLKNAMASMISDLRKYPETSSHSAIELGVMLLMAGQLNTQYQMKDFIEGFN